MIKAKDYLKCLDEQKIILRSDVLKELVDINERLAMLEKKVIPSIDGVEATERSRKRLPIVLKSATMARKSLGELIKGVKGLA